MDNICLPRIVASSLINELGVKSPEYLVEHLEDICAHIGAYVQYSDLSNCEGRLVVTDGDSIITVPQNDDYPGRTRYSIAHELGHFKLHSKVKRHWECQDDDFHNWMEHKENKNIELEANQFASEFLLPSIFLKKIIGDQAPSFKLLSEISDEFECSLTATAFKYIEKTPHNCVLIYFKNGKAKYFKWSKTAEKAKLWPAMGTLSESTIASKMNHANISSDSFDVVKGDAWFPDIKLYSKVYESSQFYSNLDFGFSILWLK